LQRKPPRNEPTGNVNDVPAPTGNVNDGPQPAVNVNVPQAAVNVPAHAPATGRRSQPKKYQPAKRSQPAYASAPKAVNGSSTANAPDSAPATTAAVHGASNANAPFKPPNKVNSCLRHQFTYFGLQIFLYIQMTFFFSLIRKNMLRWCMMLHTCKREQRPQ
jgi:hypothetical protein